MTYHGICNKGNTTSATIGAGTAYPSGALEFIPVFSGVHVAKPFVFCVAICISLFIFLSLFFWPLYCMVYDLHLLITPLVSFDHCIVWPTIYSFWLPLWYLQTFLNIHFPK